MASGGEPRMRFIGYVPPASGAASRLYSAGVIPRDDEDDNRTARYYNLLECHHVNGGREWRGMRRPSQRRRWVFYSREKKYYRYRGVYRCVYIGLLFLFFFCDWLRLIVSLEWTIIFKSLGVWIVSWFQGCLALLFLFAVIASDTYVHNALIRWM